MSDKSQDEINERANEKSRKRKEARDRMLATKTIEKGLLIVHTGKGKGKSTAAFGLVMRALGHGMRIGIIQFVKGKWETGERDVLDKFPDLVTIRTMGGASPGKPKTVAATSPPQRPHGKPRRK